MLLSRSMMASVGSSEHGPQRLLRNPSGATVPVKTHPVKCSLSPLTRWDCYLKCQETLLKVKNLFLLMCKMSFFVFFLTRNSRFSTLGKKHTSFKLVRNEIKTHQKPSWLRLVPTITNCVKIWNFPGCTRRFAPPAASPISALPLTPDNFHYCGFDFVTSQI